MQGTRSSAVESAVSYALGATGRRPRAGMELGYFSPGIRSVHEVGAVAVATFDWW
jgi:hypothetical protein